MPPEPDPYALHDAMLVRLQQQAADDESASSPPTKLRSTRNRAENREEAPEGATDIFGSASGAVYDLGALVLSIGWFVGKWTLVLGRRLFVGMFNAAHWVMHEITGGD